MTIDRWLAEAERQLSKAGISTGRLDALVLLEDCLGKDRARLLAWPELELTREQQKVLDGQVKTRTTHEPLAYIRHKSEFYGREIYIDHRVLEPRPESETIIEFLKILNLPPGATIVDVGTGSGMLAITAKLELPQAEVIAIDIDQNCLDVAKKNAKTYRTDIEFIKGDLIKPLTTREFGNLVLLCNLPYVPDHFQINPAAMREPRVAIFGGADGLDLYRQLFKQINSLATKPIYMLTESLPPQHVTLTQIAATARYTQSQRHDFVQKFMLQSP